MNKNTKTNKNKDTSRIIKNPTKIRISRPGYRKFRLADLGINIVEKNPKEFTIMEPNSRKVVRNGSGNKNLAHGVHSKEIQSVNEFQKILIFNQIISNTPYLCFSDGQEEYCLPASFQMTSSLLSRVIQHVARINSVMEKIANTGCVLDIQKINIPDIRNAAEKYGRVVRKNRNLGVARQKNSQMDDVISDTEGVGFRYLLACTM